MKQTMLLWLDEAPHYERALDKAGLLDKLDVVKVAAADRPAPGVMQQISSLLAWKVPEGALAQMPSLRWVQLMSAGADAWLSRPDLTDGVVMTCARGVHRVQMPENILAALFHLTKPLTLAAQNQAQQQWHRLMSQPLAGKTLGIVGLGTIGVELARKAAALEMRVIGCKRDPAPVPFVDQVFGPAQLDSLLAAADFVVLLLPVTTQTNNIINAERLAAMKPDAWLLNFGRGQLVVDDDLIQAVNTRTMRGAVLDVFRAEPLPAGHPFWTTENIIVLPHIGGLHPARDDIVAQLFVDNVARFLDHQPMQAVVDRVNGY